MAEARERADVAVLGEIARIEQSVRNALERVLPAGLSAAQFAVLGHLAASATPQGPAALAAAFGLTRGAMTNTLKRLEAQGLIAVASDAADGRRKWVSATPAGLEINRACLAAARPAREALRRAFRPEAFEAALPFLRSLRQHIQE
jgi:DNA-binding MarR family transcriptional regulator